LRQRNSLLSSPLPHSSKGDALLAHGPIPALWLFGLVGLGCVLAVALIALVVALATNGPPGEPQKRGDAFQQRLVAQPIGVPFSASSLTDFKWDQLFVFYGYVSADVIDREVGARVEYAHGPGEIQDSDARAMWVFKSNNGVIAVTDVERTKLWPMGFDRASYRPSDLFVKRRGKPVCAACSDVFLTPQR
jgi:hypothetical protein